MNESATRCVAVSLVFILQWLSIFAIAVALGADDSISKREALVGVTLALALFCYWLRDYITYKISQPKDSGDSPHTT